MIYGNAGSGGNAVASLRCQIAREQHKAMGPKEEMSQTQKTDKIYSFNVPASIPRACTCL